MPGDDRITATPAPFVADVEWMAALSAAFAANRSTLYATARRICGPEDAADAVQNAFVRLLRHPIAFEAGRDIGPLLRAITQRAAIDLIRWNSATRRRDEREAGDDRHHDVVDLGQATTTREIARALSALGPGQRDAVMAAYYGEMSYARAAELLGIPEGTLKSRIRVALRNLRVDLRHLDPRADG